jgi:hypothetical protein
LRYLGEHYPAFIAHTGSCANPKCSTWLCFRSSKWSLQVAVSPCCKWDLPDVISASLSLDAWTCIPAAATVHAPVPSCCTSAFPSWDSGRLNRKNSTQQLRCGPVFRDGSHSLTFRPPSLLATQVAPTAAVVGHFFAPANFGPVSLARNFVHAVPLPRVSAAGQPWRLHPSRTYVVAFIRIEYASRLNRATDGRGLSPH